MKKKTAAAVAAALAFTVTASCVSAAGIYTVNDLRALSSYLLGTSDSGSADLNGDGITDVFDMVSMRKSIAAESGIFSETVVTPDEKNVNWINRNMIKSNALWLVQSGSAIEFTVTRSKAASVIIKGDGSERNGEDYRPRYAVIVNGEIILDECLSESAKEISLFSGDEPRDASVKIIHLSEANNGAVGVIGIRTVSDVADPVAPAPEKDLHIEFVGDSITCAYGVEGKDQYEGFKTSTENFMKSYAYLTAERLNAEYSTVCYSGYGAVSSYSSDGSRKTDGLIGDQYGFVGSKSPYREAWDHSAHPVDVVVVNIGTNDNTYVGKDYEGRSPGFVDAYLDLLKTIYTAHPEAKIICTVGTMGCSEMYPYIEEAIEKLREYTGNKCSITSYLSVTQDMNRDGLGSDWHPSPATHEKSAAVLADKICRVLGIESDQTGLDLAADANYEARILKGSGADGASYFSDYDRSFWINVATGGTEAADIQAVLSPIEIKKGGRYKLSFRATAPAGTEIPVILTDKSRLRTYYSGKLVSEGEKTPFEAEFTADESDSAAELSFEVGGKDYTSVTIYETSLVKTG